ncbi:DNA mismatch repair endonuclease MutL [Pseudalkalibacillus caeni]|uniref:DNA mismatch repair protein MutL n=1 Tax=Exobacillus caeni TaxID=2574798 RepID=A0A5R9F4T9_9BACL|nr:DNA mismatch repair endonuclease MutL [Pseudalkalibacillus caeni]TLS37410.1 DNA mismatch repair endonuclease MutL [Pseudalkalibacillus caeni]
MGKIIQLDEQLANKIAAGEVVERPASVIKELVENSIDANSSEITIEVEEGGLSKIRVVDNGDGMEREDCKLAFFRHATSKIKDERDLFHINTLGFRGEALPSIAAVSHLELKTSNGKQAGTYVNIQAGEIKEFSSTDSRKGTEITVTNLFYNTPARLKHMKTVNTELGNIADIINRQAMAHPEIAFRFYHNGKRLLYTNGNDDLLQVVAQIYGYSVAKKMISLKRDTIDFNISGYMAKPEVTRASRQYISLFMNGRYIKNYPISKAIQQGYHTLLPIGRYPVIVLHVELDPTLIDVNVHPSKLEARISKEKELAALIQTAIQDGFKRIQLIPEAAVPKQKKERSEQPSFSFQHAGSRENEETYTASEQNFEKMFQSDSKKPAQGNYYNQEPFSKPPKKAIDLINKDILDKDELNEESDNNPGQEEIEYYKKQNVREEDLELEDKGLSDTSVKEESRIPPLYPIGQMHGTYILAQNENGLYIIDQHAAQERIKYEFYREKVGQLNDEVQEMLVPITLEFSNAETSIINERMEDLAKVGVFLEEFGNNAFIVHSHPQWFPAGEEQSTIQEIIDEVLANKTIDIKKLREEAAIMMSCKGSIKANRHLREDEIFTLLETLRKSIDPFTCPHGRPIIVHYSTYEMEKMFKRVM